MKSIVLLFSACVAITAAFAAPISLAGFDDGIRHWQKKFGRDHDVPMHAPEDPWTIADSLVAWQNTDGGWPKDVDWRVDLTKDEMNALMGVTGPRRSTFDNRNTVPQIAYLAEAFVQTGAQRYADAARKGLDYVFREQRPTGGWRGDDVDAITFNDDTMVNIMGLLRAVTSEDERFAWLDDEVRTHATSALDRAIACTLRCQIVTKGVKTAWGQQHDHESFLPVKARSYELPAITAQESVGVVRFLMGLDEPTPEIGRAIDNAVAWLRAAALHDIRLERPAIEPVRFENHSTDHDVVVVAAPGGPPLWARYYDIVTGQPFFCNRDGVVVQTLAEVKLERRTGYAWYGDWPAELLTENAPR